MESNSTMAKKLIINVDEILIYAICQVSELSLTIHCESGQQIYRAFADASNLYMACDDVSEEPVILLLQPTDTKYPLTNVDFDTSINK